MTPAASVPLPRRKARAGALASGTRCNVGVFRARSGIPG